jgi:hypothetical protein
MALHSPVAAGRVVWQAFCSLTRVAINVTCAALLVIVALRPNLGLTAARICLKLRRPRRAYDAVAVVMAIGPRQIPDPDRTAEQMTKIAAALCTRGLRLEAKNILRERVPGAARIPRSRYFPVGRAR